MSFIVARIVWAGARAPEKEKKRGMEIALEYVSLLNRPEESVLCTEQSEEPLSFTCHFHPWTPFPATSTTSTPSTSAPSSPAASPLKPPSSPSTAHELLEKYQKKYPYEFLKQKGTPKEVTTDTRDSYLILNIFSCVGG